MIPPGGGQNELRLVVAQNECEMPNGLCFSPDESLLYINDTPGAYINVYDVAADGTISNGRRFAEGIGDGDLEKGGLVDGMKCDEQGNIWVTGPGGVWVIQRGGRASGRGRHPGERREPHLGRPRLAHAVRAGVHVRLHRDHEGRAAPRALHALRRRDG